MNRLFSFAFIGGDLRQLTVISDLALEGHTIRTYGFRDEITFPSRSVHPANSLKDALCNAEVVVLPLPYSTDGGETIHAPFSDTKITVSDVLDGVNATQKLLLGNATPSFQSLAEASQLSWVDYAACEEFAIRNAVPTVEGAIALAINETPHTLHQSRILILGYGRIGRLLTESVRDLGGKTSVAARSHRDLALAEARGAEAIPLATLYDRLDTFDVIFNTIPAMVLDARSLAKISSTALILDLASKPGGVDFKAARRLERRVLHALSLPGRVAPQTAGNIIKTTIDHILEEGEVSPS